MKILICNERFLFRYGVDRVLLILGKGLNELGYTVSVMGNHFDREIVETFASKIITVPTDKEYRNGNDFTLEWLKANWDKYFKDDTPDIVLFGGWPFFSSIPFFREKGCIVVFSDHGMCPMDGYSGYHLSVLQELKRLRKAYTSQCSAIIGVSDFIVRSQSLPDAGSEVDISYILNGADHMDMKIWPKLQLRIDNASRYSEDTVRNLQKNGTKLILFLGRWEPGCYKNSEAILELLPLIRSRVNNIAVLVLGDRESVNVPAELEGYLIPIGYPDDTELQNLMEQVDLGISVSLWEGFNLPIAEMQWIGKPVLAFNIGAHPEVILHPWYLCENTTDMAGKACDILIGNDLDSVTKAQSLLKFHESFKWCTTVGKYHEKFIELARTHYSIKQQPLSIIIDVTNASRDPANSGVIRVTRRLSRTLQAYLNPIFVTWDNEQDSYVLLNRQEYETLGKFNGPVLANPDAVSQPGKRTLLSDYLMGGLNSSRWLLLPETVMESSGRMIRKWARDNGIKLAAIFYDSIPIQHPELCKDTLVRENHSDYMLGLAQCDVVIPISGFSATCLKTFWEDHHVKGCPIISDLLPGEFGGSKRPAEPKACQGTVKMLCVSTLEPRKNHRMLIEACLLMEKNHPELNWQLTLVGNRYAGAYDIAEYVQRVAATNPRIKWLGIVDDATLDRLYAEATFTVYPSIVEGFGMPIIESIWYGRPCICSNGGVMAELASEGGCLTTDVTNPEVLSRDLYRLATDSSLRARLSQEALQRKVKTWDQYVQQFLSILDSRTVMLNVNGKKMRDVMVSKSWENILYENCLCDNWQMNHSERLAILGVLSRIKPTCCIEVGTYKGGSLSLISQYSDIVFSIDIDPGIPEKFGYFDNVRFLTGPSSVLLPALLKCLDEENLPVDFILIDGDHSAEGIKRDIESVLAYVPKKPLFVMMHDSFNPECRRGMIEAPWDKSPYVEWVDIDFIPGRVIEADPASRGEMWGGLALAYLKPAIRQQPLCINQSSSGVFEHLKTQSLFK
ncbi:glycosyltransferase [Methanocella arvoryzae]|uniref:Predicted glycosyltransferase (Group 1) n=1 Tax=Methanocella arvoryzae (strain DSM 22066 / NBRC 105507 / MRE50) TaxID=351160 RepID=Q0W7F0_METAR|nr:glycosyltransferase [Methanocella arvoryzae]CAJ35693.1 predicted glycosyltransferase (group 1) [Methanocella arvoryzae MRE50]